MIKEHSVLRAGANPGYVAYNHLEQSDLVPLSAFVDLSLLSQLIPVQVPLTKNFIEANLEEYLSQCWVWILDGPETCH